MHPSSLRAAIGLLVCAGVSLVSAQQIVFFKSDGSTPSSSIEGVTALNFNTLGATPSRASAPASVFPKNSLSAVFVRTGGAIRLAFSARKPGIAAIEVFSLSGRSLARFDRLCPVAGSQSLSLPAADAQGRALASGSYIVRVSIDGLDLSRTCIIPQH